jgi:hypothetical protein
MTSDETWTIRALTYALSVSCHMPLSCQYHAPATAAITTPSRISTVPGDRRNAIFVMP